MYFRSKRAIPIYDKNVHKAVKALYANTSPGNIIVPTGLSRDNVKDAVNLLCEYMWILEKLFGTCKIERKLDRALWVYGQLDDLYEE